MSDPRELLGLAVQDFACYAVLMFPRFELAAHHRLLIEKLEQVASGEITRLMIFEPPRHGKSLITTELFPAWYLGNHPERSVISASYGQDLADDFGRKVRNTLADQLHQAVFPGCTLSGDSQSQRRFTTTENGNYFAVGRGAAITGRGAHLLVIDDPLKDSEEARSETIRRNLHEWYSQVAYTRLQPGAAIVLVQTRWHEDDLAGRLLREHADEGWEVVSLPAIAEKDESFRKAGEALWPERFPLSTLEQIRQAIGGAAWASLYQQRPAAAEGAVFRRDWFRTYRELPSTFRKIIVSWDTAFKTAAENDYSAATVWGVTPDNRYYLVSLWHGRVEFPELKRQVATQAELWKPHAILIEDKASGQSLVQELRSATRFAVLPIKVDADKRSRAEAVTPLFEAGKVYLPESAPYMNDYLEELAAFPAGAHDDFVDSTSMALNHLRGGTPGIVQFWQNQTGSEMDPQQKKCLMGQHEQDPSTGNCIHCAKEVH